MTYINVGTSLGNFTNIPIDKSFNAILSSDIMEHLINTGKAKGSIKIEGWCLAPRSQGIQNLLDKIKQELNQTDGLCISCKQPFTEENVFTEAGKREVELSGMCEKCFDELFAED